MMTLAVANVAFVSIIFLGNLLWIAYRLGKIEGRKEANRSGLGKGTWVEVVKQLKADVNGKTGIIPPGVQGIVSGVDKWGRISIWIGEPWVKIQGMQEAYAIENIDRLAIKPLNHIDEETFKKYCANKAESAEMYTRLL